MLREHVLNEIKSLWSKVANDPKRDPRRGMPPEDIVVFEHSQADMNEARCKGRKQLFCILDKEGRAKPVAPRKKLDRGKRQGSFWQHACASFYVNEDQQEAVLEIVFGPLFGRGFVYSVIDRNGRREIIQTRRWFS
jgi:hypothetical protein